MTESLYNQAIRTDGFADIAKPFERKRLLRQAAEMAADAAMSRLSIYQVRLLAKYLLPVSARRSEGLDRLVKSAIAYWVEARWDNAAPKYPDHDVAEILESIAFNRPLEDKEKQATRDTINLAIMAIIFILVNFPYMAGKDYVSRHGWPVYAPRVNEVSQPLRSQHIDLVAPGIQVPGHFEIAAGGKAHDKAAVLFPLDGLVGMKNEVLGTGSQGGLALQRAWQAHAELLRRELQRANARRVVERA
ncbi:hypothetical protein MTBLM1_80025 [Rhodospirillaceae bacterium LM-1]|nr:hypothetical protein MTBLM1_80025 [Rhodospirillaceae bacterium LM-1]